MKKILSVLSLLLAFGVATYAQQPYDPKKDYPITKPFAPSTAMPIDSRTWYLDSSKNPMVRRPYRSTAEVLARLVPSQIRNGQFPIIINRGGTYNAGTGQITGGVNEEWYFRDGVADGNLVKKNYFSLADSTNWTTGYNKRMVSTSFDSLTHIFTMNFADGSSLSDTINTVGGGASDGNNYPLSMSINNGTRQITMPRNGLTPVSMYLPKLSTDSLVGAFLDTSYNRNNAVIAWDSVARKWHLMANDTGTGGGGSGANLDSLRNTQSVFVRDIASGTSAELKKASASKAGVVDTGLYNQIQRIQISNNPASLRALSSADVQTNYRMQFNQTIGDFYYDPSDHSSPDDSAMVIVTTGGQRLKRYFSDEINVRWFGAVADGITDDRYALQKCADWMLSHKLGTVMYLPEGKYVISRGIFFGIDRDHDGQWDFWTLKIRGAKKAFGAQGNNGGETTIILADKTDFAFGLQQAKGSIVEDISFYGQNYAPYSSSPTNLADPAFKWVDTLVRDNRNSPHAGVVIDPVCRASAHAGTDWMYPNWIDHYTETQDNGSTGVDVHGCFFAQFVVGYCNSPTGIKQNAEGHTISHCWFTAVKSALSNGQSQARSVYATDIIAWSGIECVFDYQRYSAGASTPMYVDGVNIAGSVKLLTYSADFGIGMLNIFKDIHAESMLMIGGSYNNETPGGSIKLENCQLDLTGENIFSTRAQTIARCRQLILDHSIVNYYSAQDPSLMFADVRLVSIQNGSTATIYTSGGVYSSSEFSSVQGPSVFANKGGSNFVERGDISISGIMPTTPGDKVTKTQQPFSYPGNGYPVTSQYYGQGLYFSTVVIDGVDTIYDDGSTGKTAIMRINPAYMYKVALYQTLVGSFTDEFGTVGNPAVIGYVSAINTSTHKATVQFLNRKVTTSYSDVVGIYSQAGITQYHYFQIGDITSGSAVITNVVGERTQLSLVVNQLLVHPAFPPGTWIKAIDAGAHTVTLSAPATYTQKNAWLSNDVSWKTEAYGAHMVDTVDYDATSRYAYKIGDIIYNSVNAAGLAAVDTTIAYWVCVKDGMVAEPGRQPVFAPCNTRGSGGGVDTATVNALIAAYNAAHPFTIHGAYPIQVHGDTIGVAPGFSESTGIINVSQHGVVADPLVNVRDSVLALIAAGYRKLYFPGNPIPYRVDSVVVNNVPGLEIFGDGIGKTIFKTDVSFRQLVVNDPADLYIHDLSFENRKVDTVDRGLAQLYLYTATPNFKAENIRIQRVSFKTPFSQVNGVAIVNESNTAEYNRVYITECMTDSIGRFGFEMINNLFPTHVGYRNVHIDNNRGLRGIGAVNQGVAKAAISFTGLGEDCSANFNQASHFFQYSGRPVNVFIENAACRRFQAIGNIATSVGNDRGFIGMIFSNTSADKTLTDAAVVSGNNFFIHSATDSTASIGFYLTNVLNGSFSNNRVQSDNYALYASHMTNTSWTGGNLSSTANNNGNIFYIRDSSKNNNFTNVYFDASLTPTPNYIGQLVGAGTTNNNFYNSPMFYSGGGSPGAFVEGSGATGNLLTAPKGSNTEFGNVKLYNSSGSNTDGTMTQAAIGAAISAGGSDTVKAKAVQFPDGGGIYGTSTGAMFHNSGQNIFASIGDNTENAIFHTRSINLENGAGTGDGYLGFTHRYTMYAPSAGVMHFTDYDSGLPGYGNFNQIRLSAALTTSSNQRLEIDPGTSSLGQILFHKGDTSTTKRDGALVYDSTKGHLMFTVGSTNYQLDQQVSDALYTPTVSNTINVTSNTVYSANYERNGNTVTIAVALGVKPTAASGTTTTFQLSLPTAVAPVANFSGTSAAWGGGQGIDGSTNYVYTAKSVNGQKRVVITFAAQQTAIEQDVILIFKYRIQ